MDHSLCISKYWLEGWKNYVMLKACFNCVTTLKFPIKNIHIIMNVHYILNIFCAVYLAVRQPTEKASRKR